MCRLPQKAYSTLATQLGELALSAGRLDVAEAAFRRAKDLGGLLLLLSSRADADGMAEVRGPGWG